MLGIQANMGAEGDFDALFDESLEAGNETQVLSMDWREIETTPETFEPQVNFLAIGNYFYSKRGMPIHVTLRPIHTSQKVVPSDLANLPMDDPQMIARFKKLLDWTAEQITKVELVSLTIGSEVDIYMWGNAERWEEWIRFYSEVSAYAREKFPGTFISCETTFAAFTGADLERLRRLHQYSDAIGVSYYPMQQKLASVKSPNAVHDDFAAAVNAIEDKPIFFYQIGYPSNPALKSSLQQQAEFITETFKAWDEHANRIRLLNFQWMHEAPSHGVQKYVDYYQYDSQSFRAFLGSLGLQSWTGEPKPAWKRLQQEAHSRGFGH